MIPLIPGGRKEHVIFFFCPDWEELVCLLEAPLEYMRGQQFLWTQKDPGTSEAWQLLAPVSMHLECGFNNLSKFLKVASNLGGFASQQTNFSTLLVDLMAALAALTQTLPPVVPLEREELLRAKGSKSKGKMTEGLSEAKTDQTRQCIIDALQGSFFVQFATYSNTLHVTYFPPVDPKPRRYTGGILSPALITAPLVPNLVTFATLHVDLAAKGQRQRADFVVNLLEDPDQLPAWLNQDRNKKALSVSGAKMTPGELGKRPPIESGADDIKDQFKDFVFKAGIELPGMDLFSLVFAGYQKYPSLEVTGLSMAELGNTCGVCTVALKTGIKDQLVVEIGSTSVLTYARMSFNSDDAIEQRCRELGIKIPPKFPIKKPRVHKKHV